MDFQILSLLSQDEVGRILDELSRTTFVDGRATAFGAASHVKNNLQAERTGDQVVQADELISSSLRRSQEFQLFAHPKRILAPSYSRYEPGMEYGPHVDGAIMGGGAPMRTDLP